MATVVIRRNEDATHLDFAEARRFLACVPDMRVVAASWGGVPVDPDGLTFGNLVDLETIGSRDVLRVRGDLGCVPAIKTLASPQGEDPCRSVPASARST